MTPDRWSEIERLYHAAAARDVEERATFLADACGPDDALRQEVESLLALDSRAEEFLSTPALPGVKLEAGPSAVGQRLGPYTVHALLGAGGMGDVYRAHDGSLGRDVAIKVLPPAFTSDPDRLARFDREARILASLNHPHIGAIYGVQYADGIQALVLELVEGPTLADRLSEGPVPVAEALDIARQIAEALEATHEIGIVHRDLKPANIKITPAGVVKVLDFGLARAERPQSPDHPPASGGKSDSATGDSVLVGTAPYMSPEQVRGKPTDNRTDIWAFGCVLYEMLTGRGPFAHGTESETLAAILDREPDWRALPAGTPLAVRRILQRCLQKDPRRRTHAIADVRLDLEDAQSASPSLLIDVPREDFTWTTRRRLAWATAALLPLVVAGAALLFYLAFLRPPPNAATWTFHVPPPDRAAFSRPHDGPMLAVSPDGATIAFVAVLPGGQRMIWLRSQETLASRALPGTEGADGPFWKPDSQSLGFFVSGKIRTVSIRGGTPETICDVAGPTHHATWNSAGDILFVAEQRGTGGLVRVAAAGGPVESETTVDRAHGETGHLWPYFLPDGRHFLYVVTASDGGGINIGSLGTRRSRRLLNLSKTPGVSSLAYGSPGYVLFATGGTLMAQALDATRLQTSGEPVRVAENVLNAGAGTAGAFSVSTNGVLAYWGGDAQPTSRLVWFDRDGRQTVTAMPIDNYGRISLDPSGARVAVEQVGASGNPAIWLLDLQQGTKTQFTSDVFSIWPVWSPDGASVVFSSMRDGTLAPYRQAVAAGEDAHRLFDSTRATTATDWSADDRILYQSGNFPHGDIGLFTVSQAKADFEFLRTPAGVSDGRLSPGGRWMAYVSAGEVFVTSFPDRAGKVRISTAGGEQPRWGRDDRELYYLAADRKVMAVTLGQSHTLGHSIPVQLFDAIADHYAVTTDGRRFLLVIPTGDPPATRPFTVVVNWAGRLQK